MSKTILVPTDYSKGSEHALIYAISLAKKEKAKILLLHAFHVSYNISEVREVTDGRLDAIQKSETERMLDLVRKVSSSEKITCDYIIKQGLAVDVILDVIKEKKPQLVIMGTKGAGWLKEMIIGSNTSKVIEYAKCPVIAVPENSEYNGIRKIAYATDYHASDIAALKKITEIAKPFNAEITVIHASDEEFTRETDDELLDKFKKIACHKIKYDKIKFKLIYGKYLEKVLQNHIKNDKPDIIAMSTHYRGIIDKIFGTSVTKKMAFHSQIPLLAFHHKHESIVFI